MALAIAWADLTFAADVFPAVEIQPVSAEDLPRAPGASHALRLHAYRFVGTSWRNDEIVSAVVESARLFAQCGVAVTRAEVRVIDSPHRFHFYDTPVSRELLRLIEVAKPAVFFVEDTLNRPAFDAEAIGLGNSATRPELANTIWIAHGARDLALALAHELVHVLSDSGEHSDVPGNLMQRETSAHNVALSQAQCERLRVRGEVNGLLERR